MKKDDDEAPQTEPLFFRLPVAVAVFMGTAVVIAVMVALLITGIPG